VRTAAEIRAAAFELARRYGGWALVKGGHDLGDRARDTLASQTEGWTYSAPRVAAPTAHGTGCSLSAAIAVCLAQGMNPADAVRQAKAYVLGRLRNCVQVGPDAWAMAPPRDLPLREIEVTECLP
jgi:hydroxymethylpyrimidine/phosphomethylpyrimidine kinase